MTKATVLALLVGVLVGLLVAGRSEAQDVGAGIDAYNRGDVSAAFALLKSVADAGDSDAQVNLGYLYARGHGVKQDQQEAMRLYLLSARQGNAEGMNAVGFKYRYGTGVEIDLPRAVHWFCRAALSGDPRGLNNLAIMYYEGQGVVRDLGEARALWRQAAERGNPNAMFNLGRSLYREPPTDPDRGARLLIEAAEAGHAGAQQIVRQLGYRGSLPPAIDTGLDMRRALRDQPPGKVRDCGFFAS
ncbi:MAG: sel1 repeat family protein [Enhydrobacter sp.]|nr:MAG: sel1 repeat family protein [Enhydrobacter sp.]